MSWTHRDILTLYLFGKLTHADRIRLIENHPSVESALGEIGAFDPDKGIVDQWITDCRDHNVGIVSLWDTEYPTRLKGIDSPPPILFVWGNLPDNDSPTIAIVGTRSCTAQHGKPATDTLVAELVKSRCTIVSGLANGIDMLAHDACCKSGGVTIAVIASGIGRITPSVAQQMAETIVKKGGAVVSEHPHHVAALPPYFPARNRIISGLSDAVVVVESKETGGALITAQFARKQNRQVWALPGFITSSRSVGTNNMIRDGLARILCSPSELLTALGVDHNQEPRKRALPVDLEILGPEAIHIDTISSLWSCTVGVAISRLIQYEFDGLVRQLPGSFFSINR
jgi:DNA processing protein